MTILALFLSLLLTTVKAQEMTESEVSDMCMNQIIAGMVEDDVLGAKSGLCVKLNVDPHGNIKGMDFNLKSDAFKSGSDEIDTESSRKRLASIQKFILDYQKTVTGNKNLRIDDIDIQVASYADGLGGPTKYDDEIMAMAQAGTLRSYIASDMKSSGVLGDKVPAKSFDYSSLEKADKSIIRNIVLAKKRSVTICKQLGQSDCDKKANTGFASTKLEKIKKECAERRVSLIRVDLGKIATRNSNPSSEFHPRFLVPPDVDQARGNEGEDLKQDMELAASFDLIRSHKEMVNSYFNPDGTYSQKHKDEKKEASKKRDIQTVTLLEALKKDENVYSLLDLPPHARQHQSANTHLQLMKKFNNKYLVLKRQLNEYPELLSDIEKGDFITFKNRLGKLEQTEQQKYLKTKLRDFTFNTYGFESTDFFNFYSSGQAVQYSLMRASNSPYIQTADSVMNASGEKLTIVLNAEDVKTAPPHRKGNKTTLPWQCSGGCDSGIKEGQDGDFLTSFRSEGIKEMKTSEVTSVFGSKPMSFGALKALNVYTIKNCPACECLIRPGTSLDTVLSGPNVIKTSIDKFTKGKDGRDSFVGEVGQIDDPTKTCIFTPPVAHTCKVSPKGDNSGENSKNKPINYSCPFWEKQVGLKKTVNFITEVLKIPTSTDQKEQCRLKVKTFKEVIDQGYAICDQSIPDEVPVNCR